MTGSKRVPTASGQPASNVAHVPRDRLFLWWLAQPAQPVLVAQLDPTDAPLIEHASLTLAARADILVARSQPIRLTHGHAVAIERFDRKDGERSHALSAKVALSAAGEAFGYPELAQLLRRRGVVAGDRNAVQMRELFRRMAFNILIDNTDDHEKKNTRCS